MTSGLLSPIYLLSAVLAAGVFFFYWQAHFFRARLEKEHKDLEERESKMNQKMYELAILKELGDRVGYSLDVHQIVDVITGSLHQFIEYSAVSYMLIEPEKVLFKMHLEKSVHRDFIDEVRDRMLGSLSAILDREFKKEEVREILSGAILVDEVSEPVRSLFNIPLVIGEKVVGILTVSHTKSGLYKEEEMTILYKITSQASKAVSKLQEVVSTEQGKLNAMVESMADGVIMTDPDYRIMVVNPSAKEVVGIKDKKDISIFDFIDRLGGKFDIRGKLEESVKLKKSFIEEKVLINDRFFQIFVLPVINESGLKKGEILGSAVIFHNITHEMELERIREDFTSMIVHELRSPLDGIKKISELLRSKTIKVNTKAGKEYLQMIHQSAGRMLELVNDILDLAKLEAGKFETKQELSDIKEIISSRVKFYEITANDGGIKLKSVFSDLLPPQINFDPRGIQQVLNNLLSNALKFTKSGGEVSVFAFLHKKGKNINEEFSQMKIKLPSTAKDTSEDFADSLSVAVSDTGEGISESGMGELFSKFRQLNLANQMPGKKGTGLGLAISKGIVEAHKGKIAAVSREGVGSVFYFMIPIKN